MRGGGLVTARTRLSATGLKAEPSVFARLAMGISSAPLELVEAELDFPRQLAVLLGHLVHGGGLKQRLALPLGLGDLGRSVDGGGELERFAPIEGELLLDIVAQGLGQVGAPVHHAEDD